MKRQRQLVVGNQGFTLIELMVVLVILGILATIVTVNLVGEPDKARRVKAKTDIQALSNALKMYKLDNGLYPTTEQGLLALVEPPTTGVLPKKWRKGGYLEQRRVPKDPWDNEYIYLCPGLQGDYDIISYGADGAVGGEDENKDISNWDTD